MTTTYIADIDVLAQPMDRPFMRVYVQADSPDEARRSAEQYCDPGERVRDAVTPLQDVLDEVRSRPSDWTISWKHEGSEGPVVLTDKTKVPVAEVVNGATVITVPFGSDPEWEVVLPWSSRAMAKRLARYLGLTLEES